MRTWDYRGFGIDPDLASLEHIFDPKNRVFFQKNDFFDCVINRPIRPILTKKILGKVVYNQI